MTRFAIFIFLISFVALLPAQAQQTKIVPPSQHLQQVVIKHSLLYFSAKDNGQYRKAYSFLGSGLKAMAPFEPWQNFNKEFSHVSGAVQNRRIIKVTWYDNPANSAYPGLYAAVDFEGSFENVHIYCGYLIWHQQPDGSFLLAREEQNYMTHEEERSYSKDTLQRIYASVGCPKT